TKGQLTSAGSASFFGGAGSFMSFASAAQRDSVGSITTQGLVHVAGQSLTIPAGQSVGGSGTIEGDVSNAGTVAPGNSPGEIDINGTYVQEPGGSLDVEIAGTALDQFDILSVSNVAIVDGFLNVALLDGFVPKSSDRFMILTAPNVAGTFDNVTGGKVKFAGGQFNVDYSPSSVTLTNFSAVPEPGSAALLAVGAAAMLRRRRRAC
ncbi:MAG: large repetitive protein, partial [Humisphaera sp.]|nr:large repetitive protein [Humisphaera sp.]